MQHNMLIQVESRFTVYCGKLHQPTTITRNYIIDDVTIADDATCHVTHINKQSGNTIKRGDLHVPSEDQMVVLQEALSIDNLRSWSTSQVYKLLM